MSKKKRKKQGQYLTHEERNKQPASSERVDFFISQITESWNKQVQSIIEVGKLLIQAKAELDHGQFGKMIKEKLPFSDRTAQRLMTIAEHPILSNPTHVSVLPPHWGTLCQPTDIPEEKLEQLLADGTITAETERSDVEAIIKDIEKEGVWDFSNVSEALEVLIRFMHKWPDPKIGALFNTILDPEEGDPELELADIKQVSEWVSKLHDACELEVNRQQVQERLEEESEEKSNRRERPVSQKEARKRGDRTRQREDLQDHFEELGYTN